MSFCPVCSGILDIAKTVNKKNITEAIETESSNDIDNIVNELLKGNDVDLSGTKINQITASESYNKLDKSKKANILTKLETLVSQNDETINAFYVCSNCAYSRKIEPQTLIASKIGANSQNNYFNINRYENKIYNRALRRTRNFICPNDKCPGKKDDLKHEAVMYRIDGTMQIMYTCCACKEKWFGQ
ncbi:DNA-dependent RNA polymerase 2 subunit Rpb9 [Bodo saltans virus]|jgi:DNA-directed RNA polymerase subunit M/transcription elongation factor TFIIS|uniref:DNA-dependent RNA polymerase 2 subunit Rpb9 n=1 Tax=Bodo saltans virus TaxID=2024608 RepID=A0A2H4UTX3_9VIRU|nr:DNA-dependent RNA polymerase 2 subunit Rpb9 [Bodo saltans virus]ATZ80382.1 DNA-dependent RNA polymerase 2 subunit Rpb9 [Bodo saltans virus]